MAVDIKSAKRVIDILQDFEEKRRPQKPMEISRSLEIPISSCLSLLRTMVSSGVLAYDSTERAYALTPRLKYMTDWIEG